MTKVILLRLFGNVQGVGLRTAISHQAKQLKLKGWAKNETDGTVSCCLVDDHQKIDELLQWLNKSFEIIKIEKKIVEIEEELTHFEIKD